MVFARQIFCKCHYYYVHHVNFNKLSMDSVNQWWPSIVRMRDDLKYAPSTLAFLLFLHITPLLVLVHLKYHLECLSIVH